MRSPRSCAIPVLAFATLSSDWMRRRRCTRVRWRAESATNCGRSGMHDRPRPHDLVRLAPSAIARIATEAPAWTASSLQRAPWATVRRAHVRNGVAIGVRGAGREQRFASVIREEEIEQLVTPEMLAEHEPARNHGAFDTLRMVVREARARGLAVGPIGAAGFELATGIAALHDGSDLDVLVRAQPMDAALHSFARTVAALPIRVDV